MAKNYIDNLSEEVKKGMREKAEQGEWPGKAPFGYRNDTTEKSVVPDEKYAPLVKRLFQLYSTGAHSLASLRDKVFEEGWRTAKGRKIAKSMVDMVLKNRFYLGEFTWKKTRFRGQHVPLISKSLFDSVQAILTSTPRRQSGRREFLFRGLLKCEHCGCAIVGELKKGKYVYYHCTQARGPCNHPWVREEVLDQHMMDVLKAVEIDDYTVGEIVRALKESHQDERAFRDAELLRLRKRDGELQSRLDRAYEDRLDGVIDEAYWRRVSASWRDEQDGVAGQIQKLSQTSRGYIDQAVEILELSKMAYSLYLERKTDEKRQLLQSLLSNCSSDGTTLYPTYKKPFNLIAEGVQMQFKLALLYKLFGVSPWPVVIFQNLLGIATAFTSYRFALKLIGRRLAFWVGLAVACYPTLIFFEGETLMTTVTVFLYTLSIFHLHKAIQTPSGRNALVTGLIFGLAAITRPAILPLLIVFPVVAAMKLGLSHWRSILVSTLVMIGGTMIPIAPVTIANDAASGELVLISTQAGANFYIGNSQEADGITVTALGPQMRIGKYRDNIRTSAEDEAERRVGRALSQSEVSSFWFHEAFKEIANEPARALRLFVRKLYYFWHGQEIINNRSLYYAGEYSWLMKLMLFKHGLNFPAGLLFPLMLVGVYYALRNRKEVAVPLWCMLGLALIMAAFFVCARFRQPVLPVAIIFAVLGVAELVSGLKRPDGQRAGRVAILIFILSALGLNLGGNIDSLANRSTFQAYLGSSFLRKANATQAIVHLEEARRIDAENMLVYEVLGKAYLRANEIDKAERVYLAGLERFRVYPHYNFNLGRIAQMRGRPDEAKQYYLTTITCAPEYAAAYEGLGAIYEQSQRYDSALYYYEQLYKLTPKPSLKSKIESVSKALNSTLPTH